MLTSLINVDGDVDVVVSHPARDNAKIAVDNIKALLRVRVFNAMLVFLYRNLGGAYFDNIIYAAQRKKFKISAHL